MKSKNGHIENLGSERNINLTPLKILIFSFFGALQCGFTYLPNQMIQLGISSFEVRILILTTSIIALIGVLLIGFLLDFIARRNPASIGKWLKLLLIFSLFGTAICYVLLALFPMPEQTMKAHDGDQYSFSCNETGAIISPSNFTAPQCPSMVDYRNFKLENCSYACKNYDNSRSKRQAESSGEYELDYDDSKSSEGRGVLVAVTKNSKKVSPEQIKIQSEVVPPHICHNNGSLDHCHVYLPNTTIALRSVAMLENVAGEVDSCGVPLDGFSCHIPFEFKSRMEDLTQDECDAEINCAVFVERIPFFKLDSTEHIIPYTILVTLGEMLPAIVIMLLIIVMFLSTREMETQRGNISRQWIFFPLGVFTFSTLLGVASHLYPLEPVKSHLHFYPFITLAIVSLVCVIVVLFSRSIFNSPSAWWWHTKCGMLAVPMSSLKRYRWLIFSFVLACLITGVMWNVIESWRHIILVDIIENELLNRTIIGDSIEDAEIKAKTFVYFLGALCALPVIWNGEILVDIFGHPHVIVLALLTFAIRFTGLSINYESPCNTFYEILEPLSFYLSWFGYLLIIRHYIPKKFLCGGTGIFIAVYFLLGRAIGFCFGASADLERDEVKKLFLLYGVIAVCTAALFFIVYHCLTFVRSECNNDDLSRGHDQPDGKSHGRVFHDERSKKGYFRY